MTKASDNAFPSILITEGTEPTAPAAGKQRLYIDSTSHHLMRTNSSGTETDLEAITATYVPAHGCRATRASGNVSIGSNTYTVIPFTAEDYDTDTMHDNSTNPSRIVIPTISGVTTGLWGVIGIGYADQTTGRVDAMLRTNANAVNSGGTRIGASLTPCHSTGISGFLVAVDVVLSAADYVELFVRTTAGAGNVNFDAGVSPLLMVSFKGKVT